MSISICEPINIYDKAEFEKLKEIQAKIITKNNLTHAEDLNAVHFWLSPEEFDVTGYIDSHFEEIEYDEKGEMKYYHGALAILITFIHKSEPETAYIGWFDSDNNELTGTGLLLDVADKLKEKNCKRIIGPINGSTWGKYRFNLSSDSPILPGEPFQPNYYPIFWKNAGFENHHNYVTEILPRDLVKPMQADDLKNILAKNNIEALALTKDLANDYAEKLQTFYNECFVDNPLFRPIDKATYLTISKQSLSYLKEDYSFLIIDQEKNPIGIFISVNNLPDAHDFKDTLLIKTLAVRKDYRNIQLGTTVINYIHYKAYQNGYQKIIHALMYDNNISSKKGQEKFNTQVIRNYSLMSKTLS